MKKKYIALAAALIMLLCVLCACGKDDEKKPEETLSPPAVSTDNTIYITIRELHVHIIIQHSFSKLNGYV